MATEESNIQQRCRIVASRCGARVFRNNRGLFLTIDALVIIQKAAREFGVRGVFDVIKSGRIRKVRAGLEVAGSADLIGWKTYVITPDMVGKRIAVFAAPEIKTLDGRTSKDQQRFIDNVKEAGGIAGIVRSEGDMEKLFNNHKF